MSSARQPLHYRRLDDAESTRYKFELVGSHERKLACLSGMYASNGYVTLLDDGRIRLKGGYRWDGPSGPTLDTVDWMWASLVHDALYQLGREGLLPERARKPADDEMLLILKAEGMPWWRRAYSWAAVRMFGPRFHGKLWNK